MTAGVPIGSRNIYEGTRNMRIYLTQEIVYEVWKILTEEGEENYDLTIWSNYPDKLIRRTSLLFSRHLHEIQDGFLLLV